MNIKSIAKIAFAGAACLGMSTTAFAAPLQQDLTIPLAPKAAPAAPAAAPQVIRPDDLGRLPIRPFQPPRDRLPQSDQPVLLNAEFAGWEGANGAASGKRTNGDLRGNWLMVDANGSFEGVVIPGKGADLSRMNIFLMHMGRLVKHTTVDESGNFSFTNVRQGAYALTGWGEKGFFSFGVNILANNPNATDNVPTNRIVVTAFQNETNINTDWIKHYSSRVGFRVFGRYEEGEGAKDDPGMYGSLGLYNNLPSHTLATSLSSHIVKRTADGRLVGRIHLINSLNGRPVDVRTTKVLLLEDDSVVAATAADNYGIFEFEEVPDGSYGVLAAGIDSVGLIGITVEGDATEAEAAESAIDFTMIPGETVGWLNDYAAEVAFQRNISAPRKETEDPNSQYGCPYCNNQAGGCSTCQQQYLQSICRSRGITFEQWQLYGCQNVKSGFGDGRFIKEVGRTLRRQIDKADQFYENAFYSSDGISGSGNNGLTAPMYNPNYNNGPGYNQNYTPNYVPHPAPAPAIP